MKSGTSQATVPSCAFAPDIPALITQGKRFRLLSPLNPSEHSVAISVVNG